VNRALTHTPTQTYTHQKTQRTTKTSATRSILAKIWKKKENNNSTTTTTNRNMTTNLFVCICLLASSTVLQHAHTSPKDDKADKGERPKHPQDKLPQNEPLQTTHTFSCALLLSCSAAIGVLTTLKNDILAIALTNHLVQMTLH
jgi:hypothetical protein